MVSGALLVEWMMWSGQADVLFTSYVPLRAEPPFYLGVILFAVGALLVVGHFFATLVVAKREQTYQGSLPLVTFGALTAAIIAVITLLHGALVYIPTFLWSLGMIEIDPSFYRLVWWGLGHSSQQINVAAMVSIWYLLGALTVGCGRAEREGEPHRLRALHPVHLDGLGAPPARRSRLRARLEGVEHLLLHVHGGAGQHDPRLHRAGRHRARHAAARRRRRACSAGCARAPWGDPGFCSLVLSVVVFGFVGGITGVTIGTEQINIIAHNTLRIPGHFHATVVRGTAMAFMGITYYLIPLIFRREVAFFAARAHPALPVRGSACWCSRWR